MTQTQKLWLSIGVLFTLATVYFLKPILMPFLVGALFAYLGDPLVKRLMYFKLPRTLAVILVFGIIMAAVLALIFFLVPVLTRQLTTFIQRLPTIIHWSQETLLPWINQHAGIDASFDLQDINFALAQHWQQAGSVAAIVGKTIATSSVSLIGWIIKLLLIPIVTFYLLRDWNKVIIGLRHLLPRRVEPWAVELTSECNSVLGAFLRGQLLVMIALGIIYSLGLSIIGLDLALLIGSITGLLSLIPYLGFTIGLIAAGIAAFVQFHTWLLVGYVILLFAIGHVLENFVLVPLLVGDRIGLHPVAVIFAVLAGGHLLGFVGVLIALPVAAIIMVLLRHIKQRYVKSELYSRSHTR